MSYKMFNIKLTKCHVIILIDFHNICPFFSFSLMLYVMYKCNPIKTLEERKKQRKKVFKTTYFFSSFRKGEKERNNKERKRYFQGDCKREKFILPLYNQDGRVFAYSSTMFATSLNDPTKFSKSLLMLLAPLFTKLERAVHVLPTREIFIAISLSFDSSFISTSFMSLMRTKERLSASL